jgi:hypothetical protein
MFTVNTKYFSYHRRIESRRKDRTSQRIDREETEAEGGRRRTGEKINVTSSDEDL